MAVRLAFFDLDKTMLATNSGALWVKRELELGHLSRWQAFQAAAWMVRYHLGFAKMESALERAIRMLTGIPEQSLIDRTREFYDAVVKTLYRPGALRALGEHRAKGDRLVLLTSSSGYMADLVSRDIGLDHVLCNRFEVGADGLCTGRPLGNVCFGPGKLTHALSYASSVGAQLSEATFYTDSYSDLPVLLAVGHPVAVNPDQRLRREALRRGWPTVDWGTPDLPSLMESAHP